MVTVVTRFATGVTVVFAVVEVTGVVLPFLPGVGVVIKVYLCNPLVVGVEALPLT